MCAKKSKILFTIAAAVIVAGIIFLSGFLMYKYVYLQKIPELALVEDLTEEGFSLYAYKGEADSGITSHAMIKSKDDFRKMQDIVRKLVSARGRQVTGDIENKLVYPAYAMTIQSNAMGEERKPGQTIVYCNGYLYTESGNVYKCDMDMEQFFDSDNVMYNRRIYEWKGITGSEAFRPMCYSNGKWDKDLLKPARDEIMEQGRDITGEIVKLTEGDRCDVLDIKLKNNTDKDWCYEDCFQYIAVGVEIDGKLYTIPGNPSEDTYVGVMPMYSSELKAGEEIVNSFNLGMFGKLPPGDYKIVIFGFFGDDSYCALVPYQAR